MNSTQERLLFSERLQQALRHAEYSPDSPTQLAREFNVRFEGNPVTVHAARKWLQGESIPTQEKLRALASWLDVPADWLRFGSVESALAEKVKVIKLAHATPSSYRGCKNLMNIIARLPKNFCALSSVWA